MRARAWLFWVCVTCARPPEGPAFPAEGPGQRHAQMPRGTASADLPDGERREPAVEPQGSVLRRFSLALHTGNLALAQRLLLELDLERRPEAQRLVDAAGALRVVDPRVVGVLLPLSGRYAKLGQEVKVAFELAAEVGREGGLVFQDSAGTPEGAAEGVDELTQRAKPLVIVGPIGESEAAAAAARAAYLGVPIALLSPAERLANVELGVFRLWTTEEERAAAAARAAAALGYVLPAVLAPRDEHGVAQAQAFAEAAARAGIPVVRSGTYDPTASALEPDVKAFLGLNPARNARLRKHLAKRPKDGWKTFSPEIDFDLLFLPDEYDHASLVVAFLRFFNVELRSGLDLEGAARLRRHEGRMPRAVQLFGSSGWHHPDLLLRGGADVEGAYVIDVCQGGEEGARAAFAENFHALVGRPPTAVAAQAYDAMTMVLSARRRAVMSGKVAQAFYRALASERVVDGACGSASVNREGELDREMVIYRVEGGEFVELDSIE